MDRRLLLAVALSIGLLVAWQWIFPPPERPAPPPVASEAPAGQEAPSTNAEDRTLAPPAAPTEPHEPAAAAAEEPVTIETTLYKVTFTNRGAQVQSWILKDYAAKDGQPVELVPPNWKNGGALPLALDLDDKELADRANAALFVTEQSEVPAIEGHMAGRSLRFTWADESGLKVEKALVFRDGEFTIDLHVSTTRAGQPVPSRVTWGPGFGVQEDVAPTRFHYEGQLTYLDQGVVTRKARGALSGEERHAASGLAWAGLEEQYFAALIIPATPSDDFVLRTFTPKASPDGKTPSAENLVAVPVGEAGATLFVGPKRYNLLASLGHGLEAAVWFSNYAIFLWPARGLFHALIWIHEHVTSNYGLAMVLLTLALRIVLFPLNQYSMLSMRKMQAQMQRVQPKVNSIRNKHKKKDAESRKKMNEEMMALYQREGINPVGSMSGCLPMFAQFPILIAFYDMILAAVELRGAPFYGWIHDLSRTDPYGITPILTGITMFAQQMMSMTKTTDPAQRQQQRMMLIMPVIFTYTFFQMPSGLALYWFVNNLLGIGQQWLVNRHMKAFEAAPQKV